MFNVGGPEVFVILLVALIVLGPDKLPEAARQVGRAMHELRKLSNGFQAELRAALDQPFDDTTTTSRRDVVTNSHGDAERSEVVVEPVSPDDDSTMYLRAGPEATDVEPPPATAPIEPRLPPTNGNGNGAISGSGESTSTEAPSSSDTTN